MRHLSCQYQLPQDHTTCLAAIRQRCRQDPQDPQFPSLFRFGTHRLHFQARVLADPSKVSYNEFLDI